MKSLRFFAAIFLFAALPIVPQQAYQPNSGHENAKPQPSTPTVDQTSLARPSPPKEENRANSESNKTGWGERLLKPVVDNWPLIVVAIVGIIVANRTLKSIDKQVEEMQKAGTQTAAQLELEHRPWVAISPTIVTPLTFNREGLRITVRFLLKNVGNSPALKTIVSARLESTWDRTEILAKWKAVCTKLAEDSATSLPNLIGMSLFPGEYFQYDMTFTMTPQGIAASLDPKANQFLNLTIMGCADYQFSFADGHHQTRFLYDVKRYSASDPFLMMIDSKAGTVPFEGDNRVTLFRHIPSGSEAT